MVAKEGLAAMRALLTKSEQNALNDFLLYLQSNFAKQVKEIALFGSKARGDSSCDSDVDVLIILANEDRLLRREILKQAARFSLKYDILLSPRVIGAERWRQMQGFSLYKNIRREAKQLSLAESAFFSGG